MLFRPELRGPEQVEEKRWALLNDDGTKLLLSQTFEDHDRLLTAPNEVASPEKDFATFEITDVFS